MLTQDLELHAVGKELQTVVTQYTPEQIADLKHQLATLSLEIEDKNFDMKEDIKRRKDEIKSLEGTKSHALSNIRKGYYESKEKCYLVENIETFKKEYYLPGETPESPARLVKTVPMTAEERAQIRLDIGLPSHISKVM